ncbi:hypothetical protein, partial [Coleofasciculus sp. F4-SAH-05]|uniref:hypothetical protein n=1 Tax=Coleofasciculus sp. F4-SAH-05 TaxID=3069525 RepID=UPI0032FF4869
AFYSGEYARAHFLLIARETVVMEFSFCCQFTSFYSFVNEIQKQFTLNISLQQASCKLINWLFIPRSIED